MNIIFDLCGPIIKIDITLIDKKLQLYGVKYEQPYLELYRAGLTKQFEAAQITPEAFADAARRTLAADFTDEQLWEAWNSLVVDFDPAHVETVGRLRDRGFRTYILSNSDVVNAEFFRDDLNRRAGFDFAGNCFNEMMFSCQLGCRKPSPEIFQKVLERHHLRAAETLFVDDCEKHCLGAASVGLQTHWLHNGETIENLEI